MSLDLKDAVKSLEKFKKANDKVVRVKQRKMNRLRERVSATKNMIFEFCPEEKSRELLNLEIRARPSITRKPTRRNVPSNGISPGLPKLCPVASTTQSEARTLNTDYSENQTILPGVKKKRCVGESPIDREVEAVKSSWQILKQEKNWNQGKDRTINPQTRKLYETLERMHRSIDNMQQSSYVKTRAKGNLGKSGGDAGFEESLNRPSRPGKMSQKDLDFTSHCLEKMSLEDKTETMFQQKKCCAVPKRQLESEIAEYLDEYTAKDVKHNEKFANFVSEPSSQEVAELLGRLNIGCDGLYESNENTGEDIVSRRIFECDAVEEKQMSDNVGKTKDIATGTQDVNLKNYKFNADQNDALFEFDDAVTNRAESWGKEKTFLNIGLGDLKDRIPEHFRSKVLKSHYLRVDPDLTPI